MTKSLELKFKTSIGKSKTLTIHDPILDLSPEAARAAMASVSQLGMFIIDGVNPYAEIESARYVERVTASIF
ncbi:MAG: DUF2922 domain-containing protein [Pisciglobus halotolerans]|nr:DUF2922 domain-containing protein [Pisciglobus halotolerans]